MQKVALRVGVLFLLPLSLMAQAVPKAELYGSYSHLRIEEISHHGWNLTFGPNLNRNLGIMTEFSGHYGSRTDRIFGIDVKTDSMVHSFLLGPRIFETVKDTWTPYVQALFGVGRVDVDLSTVLDGTTATERDGDLGFAMAAGGGLDLKLNDMAAIRIFQVDYYVIRVGGTRFEGGRATAGIVFYFGQRD